jgi:hypothetical protein
MMLFGLPRARTIKAEAMSAHTHRAHDSPHDTRLQKIHF